MYKKLKMLLVAATLIVGGILSAQAQQTTTKEIKGLVHEEKNEPLPGVLVRSKSNTKIRTQTDVVGNFLLKVNENDTLIFSYIGYTAFSLPVKNFKNNIIKLKPSASNLNEVIVIGYGTVKKSDITGSLSEVNMEDLTKAPVANFEEALAGRIAGVQVSSNSGQPGEMANITIRGGNSITQSNAPLYVVDGFPMEDFNTNSLSPDDIESINILKDASATAIYGTRGANGVIIIETKKGKIGKPVITYNGYVGIHHATQRMDLMKPYDFVRYQLDRDYVNMSALYLTTPNLTLEDYKNAKEIDWQDYIFQDALAQNHSLSLRGGNAQTKYSFSGNIVNQDGVIIKSGFDRQQIRAAVNQVISPKVKTSLNINYASDSNFGQVVAEQASSANAYASYLMYRVWGYRPLNTKIDTDLFEDLVDDDVTSASILVLNPVISTQNEIRQQLKKTLNLNGSITYDILNNLKLDIRGGYNTRSTRNEAFNNSNTYRGFSTPNNLNGVNGSFSEQQLNDWVNENTLTYTKRINKNHQFDVLVGATAQGTSVDNYGYVSINIPNEQLGLRALELGIPNVITSTASKNSLVSFLSRANYNFKSKYLFTATFRADASSKFSKDNRWAYFPSAAFAWQMGREKFLKNFKFISDSKLRFSYGVTGNNRINDFARFLTLDIGDYYSFNNETPNYAMILNNLGNTDIKWEKTSQIDAGYELSLFKNRINLVVDVYKKVTSNLLLNANIPYSSGFNTTIRNIGKIQNTGLEISLSTVNFKNKNFKWSSDFNISFNRNKVLALSDGESSLRTAVTFTGDYNGTNLYLAKVGMPVSSFYGVVWDGNYQYSDFNLRPDGSYTLKPSVATNGLEASLIKPGDIKYVDQNGDGIVNESDMVVIGRGLPIHTGGFNNNFAYKNLSLNVFFQWSYGNDIMNANRIQLEGNVANRPNLNQFTSYNERWTPENQNNTYFKIDGGGPRGVYSTRTMEDGSFLRLKTIQLNYKLPKKLIAGITGIEAYFAAQNLYTWTNYSGLDPEVSTKNSILTPGFDYSAYARNRVMTLGLKFIL